MFSFISSVTEIIRIPVFNEDYLFYIECLTRRFYPVTKTTLSNTEIAKKPVFFYVFIFLNKVSL
jgi:hypothetical protein